MTLFLGLWPSENGIKSVTYGRELDLFPLLGLKSCVWCYFGFPAKEVLRRVCDHSCVLFAANWDYYIHSFIHLICLQLVTTCCGFAVNSSYCNIINYQDNLVRRLQNIAIH